MASPPAKRGGSHLPAKPLSEDTIRDFLSVQKQEVELRLKEIERDHAEINFNQSVAQKSIDAQERDRKHAREEQTKRQKTHQNFVLMATVAVLAFACFALYTGNGELIVDLVKVVVGFIGGMGFMALRRKSNGVDDAE